MLTSLGKAIYVSWLRWVIAFSPLVIVFIFAARVNQMSSQQLRPCSGPSPH